MEARNRGLSTSSTRKADKRSAISARSLHTEMQGPRLWYIFCYLRCLESSLSGVTSRAREDAHHGLQMAQEKRKASMSWCSSPVSTPALHPCGFYRHALLALQAAAVPFLVGGGHAVAHYVGMTRHSKDLDLFVTPDDCPRILAVLRAAGYHTELTFPHWLGKVYSGSECIDVIFSSGNSIATVDTAWFAHAVAGRLLGLPVHFCPPEEILWSKSSVMERERYDGADIMHLLHAYGAQFDWPRLLQRFGVHWRGHCQVIAKNDTSVQYREDYRGFWAFTNPSLFALPTPSAFLRGKASGSDFS